MTATMAPVEPTYLPDGRRPLKKINDSTSFRPHQLEAIRGPLARLTNFILADDMGLGKSLEVLAEAAIDFEIGQASRILIVAPATLKWNWAGEMDKHTSFSYLLLEGTPKQRAAQLLDFETNKIDALVVSYDAVVAHLASLNALDFDIVVYDEAHYLMGHKSARTKACHKLRGKRHWLVTGSPLLNQVDGMWGLLHRVDPIAYPSYWTYCHRFCVFGGYKDKQIVGVKNQAELISRLQAVMVRRRKSEVGGTPGKTVVEVLVDKHPDQVRLIKQANSEMKIDNPSSAPALELANGMTKFMRIKQILSTPANLPGHPDNSYKLDRAVEMIVEIISQGRPVVVFTQFRPTLQCMVNRLNAACVDHRQLHGDIPGKDRVPTVSAWSEDAANGRPQALLCMLQVAGIGLTMTAASEAIFLDELFVPKLNEQGEDRLDRIGQTQPVTSYRIRVRKSIEQRIVKILSSKTDLNEMIVETDDFRRKLLAALMESEDDDD